MAIVAPIKVNSVGLTSVSCHTGPGNVNRQFIYNTSGFVHRWTIEGFKEKMESLPNGIPLKSKSFRIGDTKWGIRVFPAGGPGGASVFLEQRSKKSSTSTSEGSKNTKNKKTLMHA